MGLRLFPCLAEELPCLEEGWGSACVREMHLSRKHPHLSTSGRQRLQVANVAVPFGKARNMNHIARLRTGAVFWFVWMRVGIAVPLRFHRRSF